MWPIAFTVSEIIAAEGQNSTLSHIQLVFLSIYNSRSADTTFRVVFHLPCFFPFQCFRLYKTLGKLHVRSIFSYNLYSLFSDDNDDD